MEKDNVALPGIFYGYYFAMFMGMAIYNSFFAVYFTSRGMSAANLGLLFGVAPLVGLVMQPIWGGLADRAKTKNRILMIVIVGVMFSIVLFYLAGNFYTGNGQLWLLSGVMILFAAFNNALIPLQDTVTLDYISHHGGQYGYARMSGTLGYALMALVGGAIFNRLPGSVFPVYFLTLCGILFAASRLPKAVGYRKQGEKGSVGEVLRDREILLVLLITMVQYLALAYGHTYCGPYMLSLGGNTALIGVANMMQALGEIPLYLPRGRRFLRKLGIGGMLMFSCAIGVLRWTLTAFCRGPFLFIIATTLEGFMLVPLIVGVVEYIHARVPARLEATGQTALTLFSVVFARTIGNIGCGQLVGWLDKMAASDGGSVLSVFLQNAGISGMRATYGILVPLTVLAAVGLGIPLFRLQKKAQKSAE